MTLVTVSDEISLGRERYPYSLSVADARAINALTLPGGPVWIIRGALEAAANESEMAGVLARCSRS